jgi:hypothetical protein
MEAGDSMLSVSFSEDIAHHCDRRRQENHQHLTTFLIFWGINCYVFGQTKRENVRQLHLTAHCSLVSWQKKRGLLNRSAKQRAWKHTSCQQAN